MNKFVNLIKNTLEDWIIPCGYLRLFRNSLARKKANKVIHKENETLKNNKPSKNRCFILATGPSLKGVDLEFLKNELCISVSNFFVHGQNQMIKPLYHVFAPSHPPITEEHYKNFLTDAISKINFDCNLILSQKDEAITRTLVLPQNIKTYYYSGGGTFPVDFTKPIPVFRTVVHLAIYLAIYLGIEKIYLLGVDHSWILHYGTSRHFYNENQSKLVEQNYNEWRHPDIGKQFEGYGKTWDVYREIKAYCYKSGIKIINLNPDSLLDLFPKESIDSLTL